MISSRKVLQGGSARFDHKHKHEKTGIEVAVTKSAAPDGTSVALTSEVLGSKQPPKTDSKPWERGIYFDVKVTGIRDGTARVCITNAAVESWSPMFYWDGKSWVVAVNHEVVQQTVCGDIPVSDLGRTPIIIGTS